MRVLLLAPHPFYQDRGTPIAVSLLLKVLSERGDRVDVVTYHEGSDPAYEGVTLYRIPHLPFVRNIRPGFSWKKLVCDAAMFVLALRLVLTRRYDLVHSVEESVFIALLFRSALGIPYVYDMDSSLPQQMVEKYAWLAPGAWAMTLMERLAVSGAKAVVPVCDALADSVARYGRGRRTVLNDVSLLPDEEPAGPINLKTELGIDRLVLMYVGNLEVYQGIDLLVESFAAAARQCDGADLVIVGGESGDIARYKRRCAALGVSARVHFLGPKPVADLARYLAAADILVSPRIKGRNTPMKIYSYLHSGKPVLATSIPSHTQVLDDRVAMLAGPTMASFSTAMLRLIEDEQLRTELGAAGKRLIEEKYSYPVFRRKVRGLYDWLEAAVGVRVPFGGGGRERNNL